MLKVILFWYSRGIISSRKIEKACKENIIAKALADDSELDHDTIARTKIRRRVLYRQAVLDKWLRDHTQGQEGSHENSNPALLSIAKTLEENISRIQYGEASMNF